MSISKSGGIWENEHIYEMAGSMGGGMARGPEWLRGGTWTRLRAGANSWGRRRAWAAAAPACGSGSTSSGNGHGMDAGGLGLAGAMDMGTRTLGLSTLPLRPLGAGPLVA
ncbi:hypothetical protein [Acidithiobacillus sp.]|jgi:hypothetical protein|uniref:hypothetical protein n=2 Tax=Acidithiobacillus sp. TaxID=1872118 RepID=UPI0025C609C4|nr:hypothetical protein [Acidithiobacillus sp.]MCK9358358.1 hypothetical protein [Acidithiobacillus sp.]